MKSDLFGLKNIYYTKGQKDYSNNLLEKIYKNGFTDYSKEGITSYFTFLFYHLIRVNKKLKLVLIRCQLNR